MPISGGFQTCLIKKLIVPFNQVIISYSVMQQPQKVRCGGTGGPNIGPEMHGHRRPPRRRFSSCRSTNRQI